MNRLRVDGKFFSLDEQRIWLKCVSYGPFPDPQPNHGLELKRIKSIGFNSIRIYQAPSKVLLEVAEEIDLLIFVGIPWEWNRIFTEAENVSHWHKGRIDFLAELAQWGNHPQVVAIYIANEIAPEIARWQGHEQTRKALDQLIIDLRSHFPDLLYAYSSYPSSEYLEPEEADFTAINVYLESKKKLESYLHHLHHVSGDRPVLISEFGLDTERNGEPDQAYSLAWQMALMRSCGVAGVTVFSWSDRWQNGSSLVHDWSFGLKRRDGSEKLSIGAIAGEHPLPRLSRYPMFSVIFCVRNGAARIGPALSQCDKLNYPVYEVIVVDDGSTDGLELLCEQHSYIRYVRQSHSGLSAARNLGASVARGDIFAYTDDDCIPDNDWLYWIAKAYNEQGCHLCGGPNLAPEPSDEDEAVVASAPGGPSHVMLSDTQAEHIPGCNLTISRGAFELLGGFATRYWAAGDDVDLCWRAERAQLKIGFHGAAFVWHRRRTQLYQYFKQQIGYGKAEALLMEDHPDRFENDGSASWNGVIYQGGSASAREFDTIYSGTMGTAPFQAIHGSTMPTRSLHRNFRHYSANRKLALARRLQPILRRYSRIYYSTRKHKWRLFLSHKIARFSIPKRSKKEVFFEEIILCDRYEAKQSQIDRAKEEGWETLQNNASWDLAKGNQRMLLAMENLGGGCWQLRKRIAKLSDRSESSSS